MSHLYGWPSPERCQELYHLWNIYQLFPSFFVRTEEILAVGVSNWHIPGKETGLFHGRLLSPSQPGWSELNILVRIAALLHKGLPNQQPRALKNGTEKTAQNHKLVSGIIYWIFDLNIHCFAFFKPQYVTGIQDKFITRLKFKGTFNKSINKIQIWIFLRTGPCFLSCDAALSPSLQHLPESGLLLSQTMLMLCRVFLAESTDQRQI